MNNVLPDNAPFPLNLLLLIIIVGLAIGRIRIKGISVGIAGILFAAIFIGFLMIKLFPNGNSEIIENAQSTLKIFSKLGTALFVSVIGLQTGFSIKKQFNRICDSFCDWLLNEYIGSDVNVTNIRIRRND